MSEEKKYYEMKSLLSRELCDESCRRVYVVLQRRHHFSDIIAAIIMFIGFLFGFFSWLIYRQISVLLMSLGILVIAIFTIYLYFRRYAFPRSQYIKLIDKMSNPAERCYIFYADYFEEITEQSIRKIDYKQIKSIMNAKKSLILITNNTKIIISLESAQDNYPDILAFLQISTKAKYYEQL